MFTYSPQEKIIVEIIKMTLFKSLHLNASFFIYVCVCVFLHKHIFYLKERIFKKKNVRIEMISLQTV